jgi:dolichol-phosphate mannosyltransferase
MARLAMDAVFSFSLIPLYIGIGFGLLFIILAGIMSAYLVLLWATGNASSLAPGWSSLMLAILFVGAAITTLLGFIGIYVGYIFQEVKGRPIYVVKNRRPKDGK